MNSNEMKALLTLLDDPDDGVFQHVRGEFLKIGHNAIPALEETWELAKEILVQQRIENIIHTINSNEIYESLKNWKELGGQNLLTGALLVAKFQYHELNEEKIRNKINQIKQDVWIEIHDELTAFEKVKIINHVLFNLHEFKGDEQNFHAPRNSFINRVIETKKGNPLSIGILYAIIAQGLDIPIYGVSLPHHFVLAYEDELLKQIQANDLMHPGILFYLNPFNKGAVFGKADVTEFLRQMEIEPEDKHFTPCSNAEIIRRMINNIIYAYQEAGKNEKAENFKKLKVIFS